ncbi:MAG: hypothetical protein WA405_13285 [Candidatus Acidiferrales bacterium]
MAEHAGAFLPPSAACPRGMIRQVREASPANPGMQDSLAAGALMLLYVAAYIAAGFAVLALLKWAWAGIFG